VPAHFRTIGFVGIGHPADQDVASAKASAYTRRRRPISELLHRDRW
jgi:hypothetical protein